MGIGSAILLICFLIFTVDLYITISDGPKFYCDSYKNESETSSSSDEYRKCTNDQEIFKKYFSGQLIGLLLITILFSIPCFFIGMLNSAKSKYLIFIIPGIYGILSGIVIGVQVMANISLVGAFFLSAYIAYHPLVGSIFTMPTTYFILCSIICIYLYRKHK